PVLEHDAVDRWCACRRGRSRRARPGQRDDRHARPLSGHAVTINVRGRLHRVRAIALPTYVDDRGVLTAAEAGRHIPFEIRRIFYVYGIKPPFERGGHAHPRTEQLLVAVAGRLKVDLSDGVASATFSLDDPGRGLYIPELVWARLYDFSV